MSNYKINSCLETSILEYIKIYHLSYGRNKREDNPYLTISGTTVNVEGFLNSLYRDIALQNASVSLDDFRRMLSNMEREIDGDYESIVFKNLLFNVD